MSASTYYSGGVYYSGIWDGSSGDGCTSQYQMSMGAPLYANWLDEQQVNPSDTNVRFTTPSFNRVLFQDMGVGSQEDLLTLPHSGIESSVNIGLGPLTFGNASCAAFWSCFTTYYT